MSKREKIHETLRPMACLGVEFYDDHPAGQGVADCPFCDKPRHLFVSLETGQWDCKRCGEKGNLQTFLKTVCERAAESTSREDWRQISKDRGVPSGVLKERGIGKHWDGQWLIPCFSERGTVRDVRRWRPGGHVMSTDGCKLQLWGADRLANAPADRDVFLLEGEWDGCAMDWMLRDSGAEEPPVVVAAPGASVFKDEWLPLFKGRRVVTFYDADDAGDAGQIRADEKLLDVAREVAHLCWPDDSPEGWDVRDHAKKRVLEVGAGKALDELLALCRPETRRRAVGRGDASGRRGPRWTDAELPDVAEFDDVVKVFRKHLQMDSGNTEALKLMLAVCLSVDIQDDPIWVHVVGPPSAGKTVLLEQFEESGRCVFVSSVSPRSLVSGFKGPKDPSLLPKLKDKTLLVKDLTEVLSLPQVMRDETFAILRGAYDGRVDRSYGNGENRQYKDCHFAIIAGTTHAIRMVHNADLGERFLQYEMPAVDTDDETARIMKKCEGMGRKREASDEMRKAVAGYLKRKLKAEELPPVPPAEMRSLIGMAKLVSTLRSKVNRDKFTGEINYKPHREACTRLSFQLCKLVRVLAAMDGAEEVGPEQMKIAAKVALDTVSGFSTDVVRAVAKLGRSTKKDIVTETGIPIQTAARRIDDLVYLGVVVSDGKKEPGPAGGKPSEAFKLSAEVSALWAAANASRGDDNGSDQQDGDGARVPAEVRVPRAGKRRVVVKRRGGQPGARRGEGLARAS